MSMVFHSYITGLYRFILGRPTFWGPQTYILTTIGYRERFFQNIYAHNLLNYNPRLWSKFYIYISNTSQEIAKIPLHIGYHEKKLSVFKRLKNIVEVETLEIDLLGKKVEVLKFQKQGLRKFSISTYILGAIYCNVSKMNKQDFQDRRIQSFFFGWFLEALL